MQQVMTALRRLILALGFVAVCVLVVNKYSYFFATSVKGEILAVERVTEPSAILSGAPLQASAAHSFAVAIKAQNGEIFTASSEDRQWAIAKKGFCVEAKFYPYPPWDLDKSGTYFNARLLKLVDCRSTRQTATAAE